MHPVSMPMQEGALLSLIAWTYLLTNAVRVFTYMPQIVAVWRSDDGARSVSLLTWGSWVLSQFTAVIYGLMVVVDGFFVAISIVNLVGCGAVTVIAMRRRSQWKRALDAAGGARLQAR